MGSGDTTRKLSRAPINCRSTAWLTRLMVSIKALRANTSVASSPARYKNQPMVMARHDIKKTNGRMNNRCKEDCFRIPPLACSQSRHDRPGPETNGHAQTKSALAAPPNDTTYLLFFHSRFNTAQLVRRLHSICKILIVYAKKFPDTRKSAIFCGKRSKYQGARNSIITKS